MIRTEDADRILRQLAAVALRGRELRRLAMGQIAELPGYDWVGVYALTDGTLVLDEYVGARTDHTHIAVGRGLCGAAVAENRNLIAGDVRELDNYLACSIETRSEIVVLIRSGSEILGQIDVDGHEVNAFGKADEDFLESVAAILAKAWA